MKRICAVAVFAVLLFAAAFGAPAHAKDMRFPEKSPVAFRVHVPKDWTANISADGNLSVTAPDHTSVLVLSMTDDEAAVKVHPTRWQRRSSNRRAPIHSAQRNP